MAITAGAARRFSNTSTDNPRTRAMGDPAWLRLAARGKRDPKLFWRDQQVRKFADLIGYASYPERVSDFFRSAGSEFPRHESMQRTCAARGNEWWGPVRKFALWRMGPFPTRPQRGRPRCSRPLNGGLIAPQH
jgi:hypothetical protein